MTKVELIQNKNGGIVFSCEGHAGYADKGSDIVCSAVTILCFVLCNQAKSYYDRSMLANEPVIWLDSGECHIDISPKSKHRGIIKAFFEGVCEGFRAIENEHPENVVFNRKVVK